MLLISQYSIQVNLSNIYYSLITLLFHLYSLSNLFFSFVKYLINFIFDTLTPYSISIIRNIHYIYYLHSLFLVLNLSSQIISHLSHFLNVLFIPHYFDIKSQVVVGIFETIEFSYFILAFLKKKFVHLVYFFIVKDF